jgi:hypothetical protein
MIFCKNPINNKPNIHGVFHGDPNALFNHVVCLSTVKFGLLSWATHPPALWEDEMTQHSRKNGDFILHTVEQWTHERPRSYTEHGRLIGLMPTVSTPIDLTVELPGLQQALRRYGTTYVPEKLTPEHTANGRGNDATFGRGGMSGRMGQVVVQQGR